ncbi:MAG: hypothetical protein RIS50_448, partial [Bacteroidota bacterium]
SIGSKTNVTCNGLSDGTVTLSAIGGTSPYSYKAGTGTYQSSTSFINVDPGTTIYTVQDINGCLDTQYMLITQPSVLDLTLAGINVTCNGLSDGSISITGTGGTTPYQYSLNGGTYQLSSSFASLSAGT